MNELKDKLDKLDKLLAFIETLNKEVDADQKHKFSFNTSMYIKCLIHELRTPISSISIGLNNIENKIIEDNINVPYYMDIINDLYKTTQHLENTLTKFCIIQDGKMTLNEFELFNICTVFTDIIKMLQPDIIKKDITIKYNMNTNIYEWVYGDKVNITHCIFNLINNAIKYSNASIKNKKITITVLQHDESLIINIADMNSSIPKNIKENLFQPFNSTSGSGLGLYICNQILELHNGTITHEYIENGNQFNVFIALTIDKTNTNKVNLEKYILEDNLDKYNIIIIDDSDINIKLMSKMFKNKKQINNILTACDGLDAINKIYNNLKDIDIVFIDNEMPNLNGIQTIKLLRGISFDKLIIGITGSKDYTEFSSCSDYVFTKPLDKTKIDIIFSFLNKNDITRHVNKKLKIVESELIWT